MYTHILIATDGSELSGRGLEQGLALAKVLDARVTIVTVTEPWISLGFDGSVGWTDASNPVDDYERAATATAQQTLAVAETEARAAGVRYELVHAPDKHPAEGICETAERKGCDLIVMASHGRRGLSRLLLGSQATQVLSHSKMPVLIVK